VAGRFQAVWAARHLGLGGGHRLGGAGGRWGRNGVLPRGFWQSTRLESRKFWFFVGGCLIEIPRAFLLGRGGVDEIVEFRRRLERRRASGQFQAFEDSPSNVRVFDCGDKAERGSAARALQGVDLEDAL
jgi:hypothetical protein